MIKYKLPDINKKAETVILAHGAFPSHPIALAILQNCEYLVCCDGAINNLVQTDKLPNAIVGDCDSLSDQHAKRFANIIHKVSEQDTNDLTKAVQFCVKEGRTNITILGATGKREDHTIANVSLLGEYMEVADVEMVTDYGIFRCIDRTSNFESFAKQQVSLFCLDKKPITSHNLAYPINDDIFSSWWQATLNESKGDEFIIETDGKLIVYRVLTSPK